MRVSGVHRWIRLAEAISGSAASAAQLRSAADICDLREPDGQDFGHDGRGESEAVAGGREDAERRGDSRSEPQSSVASPPAAVGVCSERMLQPSSRA